MKKLYIIPLLLILLSCKKETKTEQDGYPETPEIALVSINNKTIREFQDSVIIVISYKDLNGDIGRLNPDDNSLSIYDIRLGKAEFYHIPPITPTDVTFKTKGTIRIVVPTLFLLGPGNTEKTELLIKIKDQADHWSNELNTGQLTITK